MKYRQKITIFTFMFRVLSIFTLLLVSLVSYGQNLIPNPSLESNSGIPSDVEQLSLCNAWGNAQSETEKSDYFHVNGGLSADLPSTPVAVVNAHEGDAILGFTATGKSGSNIREYIDVQLLQQLEIGKKYKVSFFITNGQVHQYSFGGYGVDQLGVNFSENRLDQIDDSPINATPQFVSSQVIFNREWQEISFSFVAEEASNWMTIGVFGGDTNKEIEFFEGEEGLAKYAYYFMDSFKMEEVPNVIAELPDDREIPTDPVETLEGEFPFFVPNAFTPDGDGNNDRFNVIASNPKIEFTVYVFDRWGSEIYSAKNGQPQWDGRCRDSLCPPDIYIWVIKYNDTNEDGEMVEKEESGTIHLIR